MILLSTEELNQTNMEQRSTKLHPSKILNLNAFKLFSPAVKEQSKDLNWGYKLNPKFFNGIHKTFISINKLKVPFWPVYGVNVNAFNNPGLLPSSVNALRDDDAEVSNNEGQNANDSTIEVDDGLDTALLVNKTIKQNDNAIIGFNGISHQPSLVYPVKVPIDVKHHAGSFELDIGNLFHLSKSKQKFEGFGYF